MISSSKFIL